MKCKSQGLPLCSTCSSRYTGYFSPCSFTMFYDVLNVRKNRKVAIIELAKAFPQEIFYLKKCVEMYYPEYHVDIEKLLVLA